MLHSAVPFGFFGMDATEYNTVAFTNNLPSQLGWWQIDNMLYGGITYSVRMEKNTLSIKNVEGTVPEGYAPVSYTHLDVYKRQDLWRSSLR